MNIVEIENGIAVFRKNQLLLKHTDKCPMIYIGHGQEKMDMYYGNFEISDYLIERVACKPTVVNKDTIRFEKDTLGEGYLDVQFVEENNRLLVKFQNNFQHINRFFIRLHAERDEHVYGCGEQFSYFNLRGKNFPLWTSEPGVGRDKSTHITFLADHHNRAGGDYYTTNYPELSYVSSRKIYCHVESAAYSEFNFSNEDFHELKFFEVPRQMVLIQENRFVNLIKKITDYTGRAVGLPEWTRDGAIIGVQGGSKRAFDKLQKTLDSGVKVSGVWCQDWQGINKTSFGKRLFWDWLWNKTLYPRLDKKIKELNDQGIKFLGYINPYLINKGTLYKEAKKKGYLVLDNQGNIYDVDFGEFYCGIVDLSYQPAFDWYKSVIIKNMIELGLSGWMADFGEYLPTDCRLVSGKDPKLMHNEWPALWARCNYEAVKEVGKLNEIFFFMRAGGFGSQRYNTCLWAGDQSVDWSQHDGIPSVIPSALSAGILGNPFHHSDIGGYTSLYENIRTKELFMRWSEMAVFSSLMRTHESNRPGENFQYYSDDDVMKHFGKMINVHVALKPYIKVLIVEAKEYGLPIQRPLFMHYEEDSLTYNIQSEYLFGEDILVAPVLKPGKNCWDVYLPDDEWIHFWTGIEYGGGDHLVDTPIGYPAVFYRKASSFSKLFSDITRSNRL